MAVQGEGETKIIKRINTGSQGSHVIIGNDSDIILMSLMCPVSQLFILAQQAKGREAYKCLSIDALDRVLPFKQRLPELETSLVRVLAVLCCAVPCRAVPCCAVLCRAVLCCAVPCYMSLRPAWLRLSQIH